MPYDCALFAIDGLIFHTLVIFVQLESSFF